MTLAASFAPHAVRSLRRRRRALETPLFGLSLGVLMAAGAAQAAPVGTGSPAVLPTGGKVVAGQASIGAASGNSLTVTQSSGKAIINWNGFSIGSGDSVLFNNGKGATLNRVTGANVSSLNGLLSATGSLYLLNPNGVIIGKGGVVNVGGTFVASTLNVSDASFLAGGDLTFTGSSNAAVVNLGKVGALGGDVALIAATVDNEGSITAANGTAGLVSGYSVLMRDASLDDGKFSVLVGGANTGVTNGGAILAANAELRAEGGNVYALAGNTAGVIRATGVASGQGKVWLVADGGTLDVAGTIEAQGKGGGKGAIETSGHSVTIGAANIDAHGGTWLVDPTDLTIDATAAASIEQALDGPDGGTNVVEETTANGATGFGGIDTGATATADPGDIIVNAAITWSSSNSLTLSAYHDVKVSYPITSTGGGDIILQADNAATAASNPTNPSSAGTVVFGGTGAISTSGDVTILYQPTSYAAPNNYAPDVSGGGTLTAYMLVDTAAQLQNISTNLSGTYALNPALAGNNVGLDMSSVPNFTPLGSDATPFTGVFDGNPLNLETNSDSFDYPTEAGFIKNLTISASGTTSVGLFGNVGTGGVVRNVELFDASITGGNATGGIAGKNSGTVSNDTVSDSVITGAQAVGGVVGKNFATVEFATFDNGPGLSEVNGQQLVGGVVGYNTVLAGSTGPSTAVVDGASFQGTVTGAGASVGGIVGYNDSGSVVEGYLNPNGSADYLRIVSGSTITDTGVNVTGVGGLVGTNAGSLSYGNAEDVTVNAASASDVGGAVGYNSGSVYNVTVSGAVNTGVNAASGTTTAGTNIGGVVGLNVVGGSVADATAGGDNALSVNAFDAGSTADSSNSVGGVVGKNYGDVSNPYAGDGVSVAGLDSVGGLVGRNFGSVEGDGLDDDGESFASVSGRNYVGGAVGYSGSPTGASSATTASVTGVYASGSTVTGTGTSVGGLVGWNDVTSTVSDSGAGVGTVSGTNAVGGLVGRNFGAITESGVELFGQVSGTNAVGGLVGRNVGSVSDSSVDGDGTVSGSTYVGGLVGFNTGLGNAAVATSTITDSIVNPGVNVSASGDYVGGLVGSNTFGASISGSSSGASVTYTGSSDSASVGGLVGYNGGTITNSSASGEVTGGEAGYIGGLVGYNDSGTTITGSSASGAVSGGGDYVYIGGLAGYNDGAISSSSASGNVTTTAYDAYAGGLVGYNDEDGTLGAATAGGAVFATGTVSSSGGEADIGGLVAYNDGTIVQAYATGAVSDTASGSGTTYIGGLVGHNDSDGSISYAYALGSVTGVAGDDLGGLVGYNESTVTEVYATGAVSGGSPTTTVGGLVGYQESDGSLSHAYYDASTTSSQTVAVGTDLGSTSTTGTVNASNRYTQSAYANLNFGDGGFIIFQGSTRPFLVSEETSVITNAHQLQLMAANVSGTYTLGADFDASATSGLNPSDMWSTSGFLPIGTDAAPFTGSFTSPEDEGFTISNLTINRPYAISVGLFGNIGAAGYVDEINLYDGSIVGRNAVGGIAGKNSGTVGDLDVSLNVTGQDAVGGVVGKNFGTVEDVSSADEGDATVTGRTYVGGVVGYNGAMGDASATSTASVTDVYSDATVNGSGDFIGGIVGYNGPGASILGAEFEGYVDATGTTSTYGAGGIAGYNAGTIAEVGVDYDSTISTATASDVGGIVGYNTGTISSAAFDGYVQTSKGSNIGGIAGYNSGTIGDGTLGDVYFDGYVTSVYSGYAGSNNPGVSNGTSTGGVVGYNDTSGVLDSVYADGYVIGANSTGGVAGKNYGLITDSVYDFFGGIDLDAVRANFEGPSDIGVSGKDSVGGLVGRNFGTISGSSAEGYVSGDDYVGGLVGFNGTPTSGSGYAPLITESFSDAVVFGGGNTAPNVGGEYIGGLVGYNDASGSITKSYTYSTVLLEDSGATAGPVGGLVGYNAGLIDNSYSLGAVVDDRSDNIGYGYSSSSSYNVYNATNDIAFGGLVGENAGKITNSYALTSVHLDDTYSGSYAVGGLVGQNDAGGTISGAYATGEIVTPDPENTSGDYGGAIGVNNAAAGAITNVYFDAGTTGQTYGVGFGDDAGVTAVGGATGLDPYSQSTYAGFDFSNVWYSVDGETRPILRSEYSTTITNGHQLELMGLDPTAAYRLSGNEFGPDDNEVYVNDTDPYDVWRTAASPDANGAYGFVPIGSDAAPFTGSLASENLGSTEIDNLVIYQPTATSVGLIANLGSGGAVEGVNLYEAVVTGKNAVGALVGKNSGLLLDDEISGTTVIGVGGVGGLVGKNFGNVENVDVFDTTVSGSLYVGGVAGYNGVPQGSGLTTPASVIDAEVDDVNVNAVSATPSEADAGGVVGYNDPYANVIADYGSSVVVDVQSNGFAVGGVVGKNYGTVAGIQVSSGTTVVGASAVGGAVGKNFGLVSGVEVSGTYVSGGQIPVPNQSGTYYAGTGLYIGGLVGYNGAPSGSSSTIAAVRESSVEDSSVNDSAANVENDLGGAVGYNGVGGQVTGVFAGGVSTTGSGYSVGGLVGKNYGLVAGDGNPDSDNYYSGAVGQDTIGSAAVGGIVGKNFGTVSLVFSEGDVTGAEYVGGVVGYNGSPSGSTATVGGSVTEAAYVGGEVGGPSTGVGLEVGGVVGYNDATGSVTYSVAIPYEDDISVTGGNAVGGVVGKNYGVVQYVEAGDPSVDGSVTVSGADSVGGLVGRNFGTLYVGWTDAGVTGNDYVGGAVGYNGAPAGGTLAANNLVARVAATGSVSWSGNGNGNDFGGAVGYNAGNVHNSYATASVTDSAGSSASTTTGTNVGGFAGENSGTISAAYSTGAVVAATGTATVGGFLGLNDATGILGYKSGNTITPNTYWDTDTSPDTLTGIGTNNNTTNVPVVTPLNDAQASNPASYVGFDFTDVWGWYPTINPSSLTPGGAYPYLQGEYFIDLSPILEYGPDFSGF